MHLYTQSGEPFYEVPYKDPSKGMRKATLADARKVGAVPSVTEIIKIMDAPALTRWKVNQGILSALTLPRQTDETDDEFIKRVMRDSKEKAETAADEGTKIHHAIECAWKGKAIDSAYFDTAHKVKNMIVEKYGDNIWWPESHFAHEYGFGGMVDLHSTKPQVVIDYKTKEKFSKKMAYDNHVIQLAAYAHGLRLYDAKLVNAFVSWEGDVEFHEWTHEEKEWGWGAFLDALSLWKRVKRYDPNFDDLPF